MNKEFALYPEAFELKQLGFDEPCFGLFTRQNNELLVREMPNQGECELYYGGILAPTYSQAFRWFREKHSIHYIISCYSELGNAWKYHIPNEGGEQGFYTYEEAELACLRKLIELVKTKQ